MVGADVFLTAIQDDILKVEVLDSGTAALMTRTGTLLADKTWLASNPTQLVKFYDLPNQTDEAGFQKLVSVLLYLPRFCGRGIRI